MFPKNSSKSATSGRYTQSVTVSFVADVTDKQSAWERSGKFEGDIMLTDEQRNVVKNSASRWPNKEVPIVIDDVFSEYCSTKLQNGMGSSTEISVHYEYRISASTAGGVDKVMEIITPLKTTVRPHSCHVNTNKGIRSL